MDSVSVLTVTQGSRVPFLKIAKQVISDQTYGAILEWVVIDGSKSKEDSAALQSYIDEIDTDFRYPIRRVPYVEGRKLGGHRNAGNDVARGAVIAWVDDDDYYQPEYIAHAVFMMNRSKHISAGCGPMFIYDLYWRVLNQIELFMPYLTVNNCLSYRREYLNTHRYDETKDFCEEPSFTNNHQEPLVQLNPLKCVVQMSHGSNTVAKHKYMMSSFFGINIGWIVSKKPIKDLVPARYLNMYYELIGARRPCPYDIVYYAGLYSVEWHPASRSLGGSEQAIVQLSSRWARAGYKVAVYGNVAAEYKSPEGVEYYNFKNFHPWQSFNILILWRIYGILPIVSLQSGLLSANQVLVDVHDNTDDQYKLVQRGMRANLINKVMFKSAFHVQEYARAIGAPLPEDKVACIMNGIQLDTFKIAAPPVRDQYRFCYASSYDRGIISIIRNLWPLIVEKEPRAELHVYYGIYNKNPKNPLVRDFYTALYDAQNVCDHGRQSLEIVSWEKHKSTFHLYLTDTPAEIDCISVRESLVAGCVPVLFNVGVFKERDGLKFEGNNLEDKNLCMLIANVLLELMRNPHKVDEIRTSLAGSKTITTWDAAANEWARCAQLPHAAAAQ